MVAKGYWNDPERTAERFRDGEVWSGDTMVVGADGLLRFRARDDAMIKVSGNRISPTEIEEAALASGAVRDAAAFGMPDERTGQAIVLVVAGEGDEAAPARLPQAPAPPAHAARADRMARRAPDRPQRQARPRRAEGRLVKPIGPIPPGFAADASGQLLIGGRAAQSLVADAGARRCSSMTAHASRRRSRDFAPPSRARSRSIMP